MKFFFGSRNTLLEAVYTARSNNDGQAAEDFKSLAPSARVRASALTRSHAQLSAGRVKFYFTVRGFGMHTLPSVNAAWVHDATSHRLAF